MGDAQLDLREASTAPTLDDSATLVTSDTRRGRRALLWAAAVVATGLASGLSVWSVMRHTEGSQSPPERLMVALPATAPIIREETSRGASFGRRRSLAISPDGRTLAYIGPGERPRSSRLYIRSLDADEPRPVEGTEGASAPFFSPDGGSIGFFAGGRLKRTSVIGGGVATICDTPEDTGGSGGTWGSDDTIVFATPTNARAGLFRVSAFGRTPEVLTTPDPTDQGGHGDPAFIPGVRAVLFTTRQTKAGVPPSVMVHSLMTGETRKLQGVGTGRAATPPIDGDSQVKFTAAGQLVFRRGSTINAAKFRADLLQVAGPVVTILEDVDEFDISYSGRIVYLKAPAYGGQLVWVDRRGSSEPILDQDHRFGRPRLSPNGKQLAVEVVRAARTDIAVYRVDNRTLTLLTADGASNSPFWHPDGQRIAFRTPRGLLWQSANDAARPEVLLAATDPAVRSASSVAPGVFSPGVGLDLLFVVHGSTGAGADIFALHLGPDRRIESVVERPGNQWGARFSPDGKWISYASDESGRFEVYLKPANGGQTRYQVSSNGGSEAVWSPLGNELFYRVDDRMMMVPITNNPDSPFGAPHILFTGRYQKSDLPQYDVTPHGERFVMVKPIADDLEGRTIRIVDGRFEELKRLVPTK